MWWLKCVLLNRRDSTVLVSVKLIFKLALNFNLYPVMDILKQNIYYCFNLPIFTTTFYKNLHQK